jgi:hypothetical protein
LGSAEASADLSKLAVPLGGSASPWPVIEIWSSGFDDVSSDWAHPKSGIRRKAAKTGYKSFPRIGRSVPKLGLPYLSGYLESIWGALKKLIL